MFKKKTTWVAMSVGALSVLTPTLVFAKSISLKDAGPLLPVFIIIGVSVILLQLIPAAILFFSIIATALRMIGERKRA